MTLSKLTACIDPNKRVGLQDPEILSLEIDSRKVRPGALFFCVPGFRADGHEYAPMAVENGASALVVTRELPLACPQIVVTDVRVAMARIAAAFYGNPADSMTMIGITGTNGKTTTSFLLKSILEASGKKVGLIGTVCAMIGNQAFESTLTTPDCIDFHRLLAKMRDEGVEVVVMEVSAHAIALKRVAGIHFDVCGFTNLSQDHLDFFGDMETYRKAKTALFTSGDCAHMVYNADDERVADSAREAGVPKTSIGIRENADVFAANIEVGECGCPFALSFGKKLRVPVEIKLAGLFNVYNALMAAAMAKQVGASPEDVRAGLEAVSNVPGRVELLNTDTPYRVILDYAHTPASLENVLAKLRQTTQKRLIALFGCGGDRDREKRPMMGEIGGSNSDFAILTSDNPRTEDPFEILTEVEEGIRRTSCPYVVIENRREAIRRALLMAEPGDVVVLAGKGHETYQEVKGIKHPFDEKIVVAELLSEIAVGGDKRCRD